MTDTVSYKIAAATRDAYIKETAKAWVALDRALIAEAAGKLPDPDVATAKRRLEFCERKARQWAADADALKNSEDA